YGGYGLRRHPALPGSAVAAALTTPLWAPIIGIPGIYLLLLYPDGKLPSPRWRVVAWLGAVGIGTTWLGLLLTPASLADSGFPDVPNPLGIEALRGALGLVYVFVSLIPISILAAAVSLILRFRRSTGTVRLQLKWLTAAAAVVASLYGLAMPTSGANGSWFGQSATLFTGIVRN